MNKYFIENGPNVAIVFATKINFHKESNTWFIYNGDMLVFIAPLSSSIKITYTEVD